MSHERDVMPDVNPQFERLTVPSWTCAEARPEE
jgi:hypothetical protein